ncbi:glycosyltransferase family 4 protein [Larsenimonas salina]|uniref:glycosyltransferase family 4 protein n=1 Tax=Larsenimonas salina TaxID=1295565 RepID=UPI002073C0E8|nr:glycosyltransferase family 4 protein [Larsenimonas salina]MCM5704648.1 glycosyltransferase family 4 protein [Larsenimonas salina]
MATPLHVCHVNLARGFRGGERQTVILIEQLAHRYSGALRQTLVCRPDSPLIDQVRHLDVTIVEARNALAGHFGIGADAVHAHEAKAVHWAYLHKRLTGTPYLLTRRVPQPVKDKWFNRRTYGSAAYTVAISSVIEQHLEALEFTRRIARVPSVFSHRPSDLERVAELKARFEGHPVIGHIGALVDRHKGQRVLLEVARRFQASHPDVRFLLLGDGEDAEALHRESRELTNVIWEGFQPDVENYLDAMTLFAFPSRNEGLGSTLLDAMDHDVPIVASRVDGIPDIITDQRSGLLVPPDDADALEHALDRLLGAPALAEELKDGAREKLVQFSPHAMADAYHALYVDMAE